MHQAVHHKGRPCHVAGIFQEGQEEIQAANDRDECRDDLQTATDPVRQQRRQPIRAVQSLQHCRQPIDEQQGPELIEKVDEDAPDVDREHEHQVHHAQEDGYAEQAVQHQLIDTVRNAAPQSRRAAHDTLADRIDEAVTAVGNQNVGLFAGVMLDSRQQFGQQPHGGGACQPHTRYVPFKQLQRQPARVEPASLMHHHSLYRDQFVDCGLDRGCIGHARGGNPSLFE